VSISSTVFARFFVPKSFLAAFSSYVLALVKNLYKKRTRLMLMKLTVGVFCWDWQLRTVDKLNNHSRE